MRFSIISFQKLVKKNLIHYLDLNILLNKVREFTYSDPLQTLPSGEGLGELSLDEAVVFGSVCSISKQLKKVLKFRDAETTSENNCERSVIEGNFS